MEVGSPAIPKDVWRVPHEQRPRVPRARVYLPPGPFEGRVSFFICLAHRYPEPVAKTKKRTTTATKPVTRAKARSVSKGVASTRTKARRDTTVAPIVRFTPKQWAAYLEHQVQREVGMSVAEFKRAFAAGELDTGDMDVFYVTGLLDVSHDGNKAVA
jgi:hypothetical protein